MSFMFHGASAFDQDLGWCVDDGVFDPYGYGYTIQDAFSGTQCASTSCGVVQEGWCGVFSSRNIGTVVAAWLADATYGGRAAEATYGHISTWKTDKVTDMSDLFYGASSF